MPRRSKRNAPAATGKNLRLDKEVKGTPQPKKTMEDLPPEMVTIILEHLTRNETKKTILGYRLVSSQWKDIISSLLEKKIISGHFPVFPQIRVSRPKSQEVLPIDQSFPVYPAGHNPFPFNSLALCYWDGVTQRDYSPYLNTVADIQRMPVPDIILRFGGFLTSFDLQRVRVSGMNFVAALLNPMTSLKVLRIVDVRLDKNIIKPELVFPTPPSLPSLTNLEVKCSWAYCGFNEPGRLDEREIIYIWLIASYANQLLQLKVETYPLETTLQRHLQHYYTLPNGEILPITTTSDSAFGNLRELGIFSPSRNFLRLSEVPKLQRLCVTGWAGGTHIHFQYLLNFISKCGNSLEKVEFGVDLKTLIGREASLRYEEDGILPPPLTIASPTPKLKTLEIIYSAMPRDDRIEDTMISKFLALFPALETLHFLCFPVNCINTAEELETINRSVASENLADQIVAAKMRLASLEQELYEATMRLYQKRAEIPYEHNWRGPRFELRYEIMSELNRKINDVQRAINVKIAEIFKGLATLGVKKQDVVVALFLERQKVWITCPNLKLVSFSSSKRPDGDVCILRRPKGF